jgi:Domain of unknown function (DUF5615)
VKLLLDEHYSPKIAAELRKHGHDAVSAKERNDLRGLGDRELWKVASVEGRALMTENVADFMPLVREVWAEGADHSGIVFTSPRSLPRGAETIGRYVKELGTFLRERPAGDGLANEVWWLGSDL